MHTIRLGEPWEVERTSDAVRFHRWFNQPTGIQPADQVRLAISECHQDANIYFNDERLVDDPHAVSRGYLIQDKLRSRNRITIEVPGDSPADQRPFTSVRLELD